MIKDVPKSLNEVMEWMLKNISESEKKEILSCKTSEEFAISCHFDFGLWLRNEFGLWGENVELLKDIFSCDPKHYMGVIGDNASSIILEKTWKMFKEMD